MSTEVRGVASTGGEKGRKLARFDLLPVGPLTKVAEHFGRGAYKYADRNWEKGLPWSWMYAALLRHLTEWWAGKEQDSLSDELLAGGFIDEETYDRIGHSHPLDAVIWMALVLRQYSLEEQYAGNDDRPKGST